MKPSLTPRAGTTARRPLLARLLTTDHHHLGIAYLLLALVSVVIGTTLSLHMRIHLTWPQVPLERILPGSYLPIVTIHGTIMLFFVLTTAPQSGFGNLVLPAQLGTRRMALPLINALGFWITALALLVLCASSLTEAGAPLSGWTAYPPLSAVASAGPGQGPGMDLWLLSIALFGIGATLSAINTLVTILRGRCTGMTWDRMPLTVWGWFTAALLSLLAFSVLLAAITLLLCDRHLGTSFFVPTGDLVNGVLHGAGGHGDGSPLLWLHLFWFFGHPEVYIAILPGMGLTSMLLANFARRRVFAYGTMVATTLLIGLLGILVWGHHMFVAGLSPFAISAFSISTVAIAVPASAKVLSWLATVWRSHPRYTTPMLFALGFVSLFITGGLTGPILAQPMLDQYLHNTYFVVAHFHLIMAMAGIFGVFAATYYWFPLITARDGRPGPLLAEKLGRWHFWCTFLGAYATFLPMHLAGLAGQPRHYSQLTGIPNHAGELMARLYPLNSFITHAALFLAASQLLFLANLVRTLRHGAPAADNPWDATTLEWHPDLLPGAPEQEGSAPIAVYRAPCFYLGDEGETFLPQWQSDATDAANQE
ncbi:MAG: cbb3-type cytochrome c oxidase subunit I [Acidobacteriota bacterium]|nr:cbb3-type cytochrome c oxidase subunit I [Acidobacteriota bacterium]